MGARTIFTSDGQYFINNLPLAPGANSIPITVTTADGVSATQSISVSRSDSTPLFSVSLDPSEGAAPLDAQFTIENPSNSPFGTIEFDVNGDGVSDFTATTIETAQATLTQLSAGVHRIRVTVKDAQGATIYSTVKKVHAFDPVEAFLTIKGVYMEMLERLRVGSIDQALNALSPAVRAQYRELFISFGGDLPAVLNELGTLAHGGLTENLGELVIVRPTAQGNTGYIITLVRGDDGIWRIEGL
jgi:hypothetical protein